MVGQCRVSGARPIIRSQCESNENPNPEIRVLTRLFQHYPLFPRGGLDIAALRDRKLVKLKQRGEFRILGD